MKCICDRIVFRWWGGGVMKCICDRIVFRWWGGPTSSLRAVACNLLLNCKHLLLAIKKSNSSYFTLQNIIPHSQNQTNIMKSVIAIVALSAVAAVSAQQPQQPNLKGTNQTLGCGWGGCGGGWGYGGGWGGWGGYGGWGGWGGYGGWGYGGWW